MKKIFSFIVAGAIAALGVVALVQGIQILSNISGQQGPQWMNTAIGVVNVVFGVLAVLALFGNLYAALNKKDADKASSWALISLALLIICQGVGAFLYWWALKGADNPDETSVTVYMVLWIVAIAGGVCLILAALPFSAVLRRFFGILGSLVGILMFGISCIGLSQNGSNPSLTLTWIIVIGGLVVSVIGFMLSIALKDKSAE